MKNISHYVVAHDNSFEWTKDSHFLSNRGKNYRDPKTGRFQSREKMPKLPDKAECHTPFVDYTLPLKVNALIDYCETLEKRLSELEKGKV